MRCRSQDVHAERLLVYGRKSAAATDLQSCEGGAKLVSLSCGDGQITGNEECDPPGRAKSVTFHKPKRQQRKAQGFWVEAIWKRSPLQNSFSPTLSEFPWDAKGVIHHWGQRNPAGGCCDAQCKLASGWQWQDGQPNQSSGAKRRVTIIAARSFINLTRPSCCL